MRICFVGDPRSIHTQRWVRWFDGVHDVSLIATAQDDALADVTISTLPTAGTRRGLRLLQSVRSVRRTVWALEPDLLHAHFINEAGWLAAAARWHPLVITAWGSDLYRAPEESHIARRLNPWALRAADWVTCDSEDQSRLIRSWGVAPERTSVVGWGVDRAEFNPNVDSSAFRERLGIPATAKLVLSPRQWLPNSNIDVVIDAFARLPGDSYLVLKRLPQFESDHAHRIQDAIRASPARERIREVAEIPLSELPLLYAAADVVVSLCVTDGTPVSLLEAMAVGCPVVALRNASVAEWIAAPGGELVDDLEPTLIAEAIAGFLDSGGERERAASHNVAIVAERADRAREMERMDEIYRRLGAGRRGRP